MKKLTALLLALAMVLSLAGCGGPEGPQAETPTAEIPATEAPVVREVVAVRLIAPQSLQPGISAAVDAFNAAYKGQYSCEADYLADGDLEEALTNTQSSGYDIFTFAGTRLAAYAEQGCLAPLTSALAAEETDMFMTSMLEEVQYNGEIYGAALGNSSLILYYNTDLLEQARISYDFDTLSGDSRITWEELTTIAKQVQKKLDPKGAEGLTGIEFQQIGNAHQMSILAGSLGGACIGEDGLSVDGVINAEPWLTALGWYQDQVEAGIFSKDIPAGDTVSRFLSGKTVFLLGDTRIPGILDAEGFDCYGFTYIPCFAGHEEEVTTSCGSWAVGMNAGTEKTEAAVEFIRHLCLYEGADIYINTSGAVPALPRQFTEDLLIENPHIGIAQYESMHTAAVQAVTPAFNQYSAGVSALWEAVRNGADVAEAAQNCVDELENAFREYK